MPRRIAIGSLVVLAVSLSLACSGGATAPTVTPAPNPPTTAPPLQTIVEFTRGGVAVGGGTSTNYVGQSVTILSGPFNDLRFSWQRRGPTSLLPVAAGRLFLFDQEYLGPTSGMGPSTPGFVAVTAEAVNDEYVFPQMVTVQSGAKYWFYSEHLSGEYLSTDPRFGDQYQGGDQYASGFLGWERAYLRDRTERLDANFVLRGRPVR